MRKLFLTVLLSFAFSAGMKSYAAADAFVTLKMVGGKVEMMVPDSLIGRKLLLSTRIVASDDPQLPVMKNVSKLSAMLVSKVDSSIVLASSDAAFAVIDSDSGMENALDNAGLKAIRFVLPISRRDTLNEGYVVNADKLFDLSDKNVVDFKGFDYQGCVINNSVFSRSRSRMLGIDSAGTSVGVRTAATFDLTLKTKLIVVELEDKFPMTCEVLTTLTTLDEYDAPHKIADRRIGTRKVPVSTAGSERGFKDEDWIQRWDLRGSRFIAVYLDTLLSASQKDYIRQGLEQWNVAFERCGLGKKILVSDYQPFGFSAADPLKSIVTVSGIGMVPTADLVTDGSDRILSARIFIPLNYVNFVRRRSAFTIADVDARYRPYELPGDAVGEVLRADVMRIFGLCLGLDTNLAGSRAYTPGQITDPAFVAEHGFTASITDDVLFNYFAKPGDRERGLATIVEKVGAYDIYALDWIYGDGTPSDDPELFYAPSYKGISDVRLRRYDLSNDSYAAFEAGISHMKFAADNAAGWIRDDDAVPDVYRMLFVDWLWLRGNNLAYLLTSDVGGYKYNYPHEDSGLPKFESLPKDIQRASLRRAFEFFRDCSWLDSSELLKLAGANKNATDFTRSNAFNLMNASYRYQFVAFAAKYAGSEYSVGEYLDDMETEVFKVARSGRLPYGETFIIAKYLNWLSLSCNISGADAVEGMSDQSRRFLERAEKQLKACRAAMTTAEDKLSIDYLSKYLSKLKN